MGCVFLVRGRSGRWNGLGTVGREGQCIQPLTSNKHSFNSSRLVLLLSDNTLTSSRFQCFKTAFFTTLSSTRITKDIMVTVNININCVHLLNDPSGFSATCGQSSSSSSVTTTSPSTCSYQVTSNSPAHHSTPPSCVIHCRAVADGCKETDLITVLQPFGKIT